MKGLLSNEQKAFFADNYALLGPKVFTEQYNKTFGTSYSGSWARWTAYKLNATSKFSPPGYYSIKEISCLFNISETSVRSALQSGNIKSERFYKKWFVDEKSFRAAMKKRENLMTPPPWPAMTVKDASDKLGISPQALSKVIKRKLIDAVKVNYIYMVRKEHVQWGYDQMVKYGYVKIPWYKMRERLQK